jgi:hypothetical protein
MLYFDFIANKNLLAAHTLRNSDKDRFLYESTTVVDFQNAAWNLDKEAYDLVRYGPSEISFANDDDLNSYVRKVKDFQEKIILLKEFEGLAAETVSAQERVAAEWNANFEKSNAEMSNILGFEVEGSWNVYITHPALKSGTNTGKEILWTDRTDWPNYNTVYLWHEVLHFIFGRSNEEHAVIELIADNELRARLNGSSYPPFEGHDFLNDLRIKLLPEWQIYLSTDNRDIRDFAKRHIST